MVHCTSFLLLTAKYIYYWQLLQVSCCCFELIWAASDMLWSYHKLIVIPSCRNNWQSFNYQHDTDYHILSDYMCPWTLYNSYHPLSIEVRVVGSLLLGIWILQSHPQRPPCLQAERQKLAKLKICVYVWVCVWIYHTKLLFNLEKS